MDDKQAEILDYYEKEYDLTKPSHPILLKAALDNRLTTEYLIMRSIECVRQERDDDNHVANPALLILQQRVDSDVLDSVLLLLKNDDAAARQLGAQVLREFPGLDSAPSPYSHKVIRHLEKMIETELDDEVLLWALSAIGWQCHPDGIDVILRFVDDERTFIRRVVGNNLLMACKGNFDMPPTVAKALLILAKDKDDDIRWSVFYDVAEFSDLFADYRDAFKQAAHSAKQDSAKNVREQANKAYKAIA